MNNVIRIIAKATAIVAVSLAGLSAHAGTPVNVDVNIGLPGAYPPPQPVYIAPPPQPLYVQPRPIYIEQRPAYVRHDDWYWDCNKHDKCKKKKDKHHGHGHGGGHDDDDD